MKRTRSSKKATVTEERVKVLELESDEKVGRRQIKNAQSKESYYLNDIADSLFCARMFGIEPPKELNPRCRNYLEECDKRVAEYKRLFPL